LASEKAAGTSEENAALSAGAALASEQAAGTSEENAALSAGAALASEQAAGTSEGNAALSAGAALASEQAAGTSEGNAALSAGAALASEQAAGTSEENAAASELNAHKRAEEEKDVEVEPGKYSAKHHAIKSSDARTGSEEARDKSSDWAEKEPNIEVEPGKYSAKHHAFNASESAAAALASEQAAASSNVLASEFAQDAFESKEQAQNAAAIAVGAAGANNNWMDIDGDHYVVSRRAVNGHIIKSISLYEEGV
jgi:hypothetical protein